MVTSHECVGWSCRKVLWGYRSRRTSTAKRKKSKREERAFLKLKKVKVEQEVWGNSRERYVLIVQQCRVVDSAAERNNNNNRESTAPKQSLLGSIACIYS
eukprot:scaffold25451_cov73-Skeletonema_dohrnii-CCMP3373.AAC.1